MKEANDMIFNNEDIINKKIDMIDEFIIDDVYSINYIKEQLVILLILVH
jgi:hypothetical protein